MKRLYFAAMAAGMVMAAWGASRPMPEYLKSAVVYQIVLHNFTQTGTFKAAQAMLDHVRSTGADVVYLTPFFEMDRDMDRTYWSPRQIKSGYDSPLNPYRIADYNKIDPIYGTDKDFDAFCAKAHSLGMKVYLDLVYLHCGPTCVLKDLAPDALQRNPDGSLKLNNYNFPLLNYKSKATRKYLIDSMLHWIRRGADGFRCDVGYQVPLEFWEEATAACWKVKPDLVMIDEGSPTAYLKTAFDSCYHFPWCRSLLYPTLMNGLPNGKGEKFARAMDAVRKYEATAPENSRFFCYVDCHDTVLGVGPRRFDRIHPIDAGNAAFVLVFLRRGLTVVYNGNEIADNVAGSIFMPNDRKRDRTRVNWARALQPSGKKRLAHIRTLAKIRHENPVFADGTQEWVTGGERQGALAFVRRLGDKAVFVAANLTGKKVEFKATTGETPVVPVKRRDAASPTGAESKRRDAASPTGAESKRRDAASPTGADSKRGNACPTGVILAERGELADDGTCRLGPWGFVVVNVNVGDR